MPGDAGLLANDIGMRALFWGAGVIYTLLGVGAFFIPSLMQLEEQGGPRLASAL